MRLTFNRQEELIKKHNEFNNKAIPLQNAIVNIHKTCLVKISLNLEAKTVDYELTDGAEKVLAEYRHAIKETHYQIYGLKMEFI